jgi:hypothetical protein
MDVSLDQMFSCLAIRNGFLFVSNPQKNSNASPLNQIHILILIFIYISLYIRTYLLCFDLFVMIINEGTDEQYDRMDRWFHNLSKIPGYCHSQVPPSTLKT